MTEYDEILNQVPIDELAAQLGVDRSEVQQAVESALPALLGGLQANASDAAGASSLMAALSDHQAPVSSLGDVDVNDGQAIVGNIFGGNTDQVVNQLGGLGSGGSGSGMGGLVQKLLPLLAPIVMSWLANKMGSGGLGSVLGGASAGGQTQTGSGPLFPGGQGADSGPVQSPTGSGGSSNPLQDILGQVLGGAAGGSGGSGGGAGDILGGLLGGLLGGGKR